VYIDCEGNMGAWNVILDEPKPVSPVQKPVVEQVKSLIMNEVKLIKHKYLFRSRNK
jgi:hypothetical protein